MPKYKWKRELNKIIHETNLNILTNTEKKETKEYEKLEQRHVRI